jgi:hypothetical protein
MSALFLQPVLRDVGDASEDVGEPGLRIDIVELGCGNQTKSEGRALTAAV